MSWVTRWNGNRGKTRNALASSDHKMLSAGLRFSVPMELATVGKAKSPGEPVCQPF